MQLKKLLQGSAFALVAAACAIAVPSVVKAADGDMDSAGLQKVTVDGASGSMTITGKSGVQEILVGIGKVNAKKGAITVASWGSYDGATATVDLSKLSNVKDNYFVITTAGSKDVSIVKIPAANKVTKAKYNAGTGELQLGTGANASAAAPASLTFTANTGTVNLYELRTAYGNWSDLVGLKVGDAGKESLNFKPCQEEGATLFVRVKGGASADAAVPASDPEAYTYGTNETKNKVFVAGSLPGKEVKVSIPAKAKGPNAVADYTKGTVKFPKGSEYRLASSTKLQAADTTTGKYTAGVTEATDVKKLVEGVETFKDLKSYDIEVRKAATDKKAASKWSRLSVTVPQKMTATALPDDTSGKELDNANSKTQKDKTDGKIPSNDSTTADKEGGDTGITKAVVKEKKADTASVLNIKYVTKGKLDATKFYTANAIEIENKGEKTYEVIAGGKVADTDAPTSGKVTKIAAGKKVVLTGIDDGTAVWIRVAGDKKAQRWVGAYDVLGIVDYPYTVPKKEATQS